MDERVSVGSPVVRRHVRNVYHDSSTAASDFGFRDRVDVALDGSAERDLLADLPSRVCGRGHMGCTRKLRPLVR